MIPEVGQRVKCFLRNSMALEGTVENWSDTQVILRSFDGESLMIIHTPSTDIVMTKVLLSVEPAPLRSSDNSSPVQQHISRKLQEVLQPTENQQLNEMNLEQLKALSKQQDREILAQKKLEHFGTSSSPKFAGHYSLLNVPMPQRRK